MKTRFLLFSIIFFMTCAVSSINAKDNETEIELPTLSVRTDGKINTVTFTMPVTSQISNSGGMASSIKFKPFAKVNGGFLIGARVYSAQGTEVLVYTNNQFVTSYKLSGGHVAFEVLIPDMGDTDLQQVVFYVN